MMQESSIKLTKYILLFSFFLIVGLVVLSLLKLGLNIDIVAASNPGVVMGAGFAAVLIFVTDNKRAPSKSESNALAFLSLLSAVSISIICAALISAIYFTDSDYAEIKALFSSFSSIFLGVVAIVICLLNFFILKLVYGLGARKFARLLHKNVM